MRVLFLVHSHPDLQAGGTEIFSRDLFRGLRQDGVEGVYLAATSPVQRPMSPGTPFQTIGDAADELLLYSGAFDPFFMSQIDLHNVAPAFAMLLKEVRPDVVHVHHLLVLGTELLGLIRRTLPRARIVMTLHDYYGICAHDGQMATPDGTLCDTASTDACRRCFPDRTLTDFRLRALHLRTGFDAVDAFIAPSVFLRERFIAWGLPAEKITVVRNGIPAGPAVPPRMAADGRRDRFAFFGHVNRFKGASVALDASARLSRAGVAHALALHGGTAHQAPEVVERFEAALAAAPDARHLGPYRRFEMLRLIAQADWVVFPSVWWENAPLVIQEAFQHWRPVICSDIGGAAEAVRDGIDGLHFPVGDGAALAQVMRRAIEEPGLWQRLVDGMSPPAGLAASVAAHRALYAQLLATAPVVRRAA